MRGWVGLGRWLHGKVVYRPNTVTHLQYQPTDSAAAGDRIELTTIELQVRRPNHKTIPTANWQLIKIPSLSM